MDNTYMSGSELRQFLHISTRKMKFLMDNNLIPHENTGLVSHKYIVKLEDAKKFKKEIENNPDLMIQFKGMFTSRTKERRKKDETNVEWILLHKTKYKAFIRSLWTDLPNAIPAQQVAKIIGINPKSLHRLNKEGKLNSVNVSHVQYCSKEEIIKYLASETQVRFNRTPEYLVFYNGFLKENGIKQ